MKQNWGKWLTIGLLLIFLIVLIRGYVLQSQEAQEDKEIRNRLFNY